MRKRLNILFLGIALCSVSADNTYDWKSIGHHVKADDFKCLANNEHQESVLVTTSNDVINAPSENVESNVHATEKRAPLLQHLAIIPDGNRRWAKANKLEASLGHRKGLDIVHTAARTCIKNGIKHLSIYTFSLENFRRSEAEKSYLFSLIARELRSSMPEFVAERIRIKFVGDSAYYPEVIKEAIKEVEAATASCDRLNLNILFCYGARQELANAAKIIAQKVQAGELDIASINEEVLTDYLWTAGTPDPELIIRTGSAQQPRMSNYLLFQAAYSEWMFLDEYWPEITEDILQSCIEKFSGIQRNFGR